MDVNGPVTPDPHGQWESIPLAFRRNAQRLEVPVAKEPPFCDVKTTTQLAEAQLKFDFDVMEDINMRDVIWRCMQFKNSCASADCKKSTVVSSAWEVCTQTNLFPSHPTFEKPLFWHNKTCRFGIKSNASRRSASIIPLPIMVWTKGRVFR